MNRYISLLVVVFSVLATTKAYDFKDPIFNEYLFNELQSAYEDNDATTLIHRSRRDVAVELPADAGEKDGKSCGRRDWQKDFLCCKGDKFDREHLEAFKEAKKQCITELRGPNDDTVDPFDCEKMQQVKEQMICVSECVAKKFNMMNEKGELKRDVILENLRTKIGDVQWKKDSIEGHVDKCLDELREEKAKQEKLGETANKGCNGSAITFHRCIWRESYTGCPADLRIDTPKCNKIRDRMAKGDTSYLSKHFLHKFLHGRRDEE